MRDTELYRHLLGIEEPWRVIDVELDIADETVRVFIDFDVRNASFCCPECGKYANLYDRREARSWRHLDSCQFKTYLVASLPRVNCREHGTLTPKVFWCEPSSRFTAMFERFALDVLLATQVQSKAARILRLSADQMEYLMRKAVSRGLKRRDANETIKHAALDEKAFHEGHSYATVLSDLERARVIEMTENRTIESAVQLLETALSPAQKESVRSVTMDMWPAFANARAQVLPKAEVIHDRFHVTRYLNDAVDMTRKDEHRKLSRQDDDTLAKSKYLWLRSQQNMTEKQKQALTALSSLELETAQVWAFKECFRQFFDCKTEYGAQVFFRQWHEAAVALGNAHLNKVAKILNKHLNGLIAYIRHRMTNALAENLNGQIQRIKTNARGFRRFANFRLAVLFYLGKLELYPQTSR